MPQSLKLPDGYKVLDSGKEPNKGLYRMIKRPNGTVYKEWYHLYSPEELQRKVDAENKSLGQLSSSNLRDNTKNAMGLTAATGLFSAGAYYNMSADRQAKLKRLVRGATLGKTKPQGIGLKTPTASAGDVRGRVSPDRPPAIVRSVDSFNKGNAPAPKAGQGSSGGSKMPQTGDLFSQPEAPKTGTKGGTKGGSGTRASGSGTKPAGSGTKPAGSGTKPAGSGARTRASAKANPTSQMPEQFRQMPKAGGGPTGPGRTNVRQAMFNQRMSQLSQGRAGTGTASGRANVDALVKATEGRTQSGATSRPTGPGQQPPKMSAVGPEFNASRTVVTGNRTVTNPGATLVPTRPSPNTSGPLVRPIPEAKWRVVPPQPKPTGGAQLRVVPPQPKPTGGLLGKAKGFVKASIPAAIATHMLEDAGAGVMSAARGDWKGAGQRGLDLLSHTKFGGLIPVADQAMKGITGKGFRDNATSLGDKIIHAKYIDGKQPAPSARATPAASGGGQSGGTSQKPSGPAYFPEAARNGSAVRTPDSYLGEAFDYSLQKGTTSGTKYLEHMFRRDKISEDDQQRLRERFNKKVVGDQTLKTYGADRGITENVEGKTPGLGKELLNQYRANNPGNKLQDYRGNTDYGKMRSAAEARLAASKK